MTAQPTLFLDFDGTITRRDATDAILEAFADPSWVEVERAWQAGRIGSRECLQRQMALVTAAPAEVDALLDTIELDAGFPALLALTAAAGIPCHIVSDGFDYCIQRILRRPSLDLTRQLEGVRVVSSHLEPRGAAWQAAFPQDGCAHGCATCKPSAIAALAAHGPRIFVGDGLSDRHAAACADLVFAKDSLAAHCDANGIAYVPFDGLAAVASHLAERLCGHAAAPERSSLQP